MTFKNGDAVVFKGSTGRPIKVIADEVDGYVWAQLEPGMLPFTMRASTAELYVEPIKVGDYVRWVMATAGRFLVLAELEDYYVLQDGDCRPFVSTFKKDRYVRVVAK